MQCYYIRKILLYYITKFESIKIKFKYTILQED